jgi:hypothetical protein
MDLEKSIKQLIEEKKRIEKAIAVLESILAKGPEASPATPAKKRGRKGMSESEREEVSRRMKQYWRKRRQQKSKD